MARQNYFLAGGLFTFSLFFLFMALDIDANRSSYSLGPAFWPMFLLISMMILSIVLVLRTKFSKKVIVDEDDNDLMEEFLDDESKNSSLVSVIGFSIIAALLAYIVIIPWVGFVFASFLFIAVIATILGQKLWNSFVFSLVSSITMAVFFIGVLNISFPKGIGVFRTLSSLFS